MGLHRDDDADGDAHCRRAGSAGAMKLRAPLATE
jgi:hypothetical protein